MTQKIPFTQAGIAKIQAPESGRDYYRDSRAQGLVLCVWHTVINTFEFYKWIAGRPVRMKVGRFPEVTVEQARTEVLRMTGELAAGKDPADQRRKARAETAFGELFTMYIENHAKPHKRSWQCDQSQYNFHLKAWAARKLSNIKRDDVAALHAKIGRDSGQYGANRVLALISVVFNYAASLGYEGINPARSVRRFKEQSRDRFLRADELKAFFTALLAPETPELWRDFFTVALLTGARRSNVQAMKWADLALDRGVWRIPEQESKNKEPLICVLAEAAVKILRRRRQTAGDNAYVFPSYGSTGHITEPKKIWAALLARAGIEDLRLHDLRRTLGSWQAATGASLSIIGRALGHKNVATTAIYARLDLDPVRQSVNTATMAIMAAANREANDGEKTVDKKQLPAPHREE